MRSVYYADDFLKRLSGLSFSLYLKEKKKSRMGVLCLPWGKPPFPNPRCVPNIYFQSRDEYDTRSSLMCVSLPAIDGDRFKKLCLIPLLTN